MMGFLLMLGEVIDEEKEGDVEEVDSHVPPVSDIILPTKMLS